MADKKITELTGYTPPIDTDVLPIVDVTTSTTKKITWANIKANMPSQVEDSVTDGHTTVAPSGNAVYDALALKAPLISPSFTTPALGTPTSGNLANCTFPTLNQNTTGTAANLSGTPDLPNGTTATTQSANDNSTKLATTAYVDGKASGSTFWTAIAATRTSNTTVTVTGDQTAIFKKGMIVKWTESSVVKVAYVSIPSTYSSVTTITFVGSTCASIDSNSFKYATFVDIEQFKVNFAYAGTIGSVATDCMNAYYAPEPMSVLGAEIYTGTVASTSGNTVIDINKNGSTLFTTKPTIAYNALTVATPFTADSGSTLALNDRVSIDIDTVTSTTFPVDLYVSLKVFPTRLLSLT